MADQSSVRQRIIASVFSRRNAAGTLEETYVSHVKIWEDAGPEGGARKPRYILLSQASNGSGFIHKSKLNTNGSFSVGKTWKLIELRAVQVVNPLGFNITLSRTYRWQTENLAEQTAFIAALVQLFRTVTGGSAPLQLEGFSDPSASPPGRQAIQSDYLRQTRTSSPTPANGLPSSASRRPGQRHGQTPSQSDLEVEIPPLRAGLSSQPASPSVSNRAYPPSSSRPIESSRTRDPSPSSRSISSTMPRQVRRPSNAGSTSSQIPSISLPTTQSRAITPKPRAPPLDNVQNPNPTMRLDIPQTAEGPHTPGSAYQNSPGRSASPSPAPSVRSTKRGPTPNQGQTVRRDHNARISFFDPANQATLDRLITGGPGQNEVEGEEESAQATMSNVEEMLEGYEWASDDVIGGKTARGAADLIEARLLDELMALDKANIHSFLESDDRVGIVLKFMDEAIQELDSMDSLVQSYKIHLNAVGDEIGYIQSQNRGLQVQTQNQQALLSELQNLLQTVQVSREALMILSQESLEKPNSIQRLEEAATELYKALQAGRDTDMAATMERLEEYRTHNAQFCKRMFDFLSIMFTAQAKMLLGDTSGISKEGRGRPTIIQHRDIETYLGRYAGLMLYLKEMDEKVYGKLCAAYFSAASELHSIQLKSLFSAYINFVKKAPEEDTEATFGTTPTGGNIKAAGAGMRRAGTIIRSPMEARHRDRERPADGNLRASEAFGLLLEQLAPQIYREDDFITDFLQINDAALTFADYMGLDNYFRRQALRMSGLSQPTMKLVRGAMDLIFGFLPAELKSWLDGALSKDNMQIIGLLGCLERFLADADERGNTFLMNVLEKQHMRLKGLFDRHVNDQIKGVEQTKLTSKKRKGVVHFIKYFPIYIGRVESQLIGLDGLEIRASVDAAYEKIVQTMFDSLKQMAKMDGEGEDKGQLNYHVILIENMHHFVAEIAQLEIGSVTVFLRRAESIYEENLSAYVKIVLRRPFSKIIDYFEGVERLLKTTAPTEVATNSNYNKSALKKVVKEYNAKDVRKHVDSLFKRVEKHFTEASEKATTEEKSSGIAAGTVMVGVWKACEEELLRITELFTKRISQCYPDTGVTLDYSANDVEAAFRRHRVGF